MLKSVLHHTITDNLMILLKAGAFDVPCDDDMILMSPSKWRKLALTAEHLGLLSYVADGVKILEKQKNLSPVLLEVLAIKGDVIDKQRNVKYDYSKAKLFNFYTSQRWEGVVNEETSGTDISEETLNLLDIIIAVMDDMITKDIDILGMITLGTYIRQHKNTINFQKLNSWLTHIGLVHVASLEGNILIYCFGFNPEELPFVIKEDEKSSHLLYSKLENAFNDHSFDNATRMNIAMLETVSYQFMKAISLITDIEE